MQLLEFVIENEIPKLHWDFDIQTDNLPPEKKDQTCDNLQKKKKKKMLVSWLFGFYDISTFVVYLTPNPFSCK